MILEPVESKLEGGDDNDSFNFGQYWTTPGGIGALLCFTVLFVASVIRLKRAIPVDPSSISLFTVASVSVTEIGDTGVKGLFRKSVKHLFTKPLQFFFGFWKKFPRRLWNFYIEAFLVPSFRQEWGKYQDWSYRSPPKPSRKYKKHHKKAENTDDHEEESFGMKRQSMVSSNESVLNIETSDTKIQHGGQLAKYDHGRHPRPEPHDHSECQRVRINVGGCIYETQMKTLNRYPDTLLGNPNRRIKYYNPITEEYFFDRNRLSFETILFFYQSGGRFRRPDFLSTDILLDDAKFYGLPQNIIYQYLIDEGLTYATQPDEILPKNLLMRKIWLLFDYPESSLQARIVAVISITSIVLSITTFCMETEKALVGRATFDIDDVTGKATQHPFNPLEMSDPFFIVETLCSAWFSVEFLARFLSCPDKLEFVASLLNAIDFLAIVPYFFQILTNVPQAPIGGDDMGMTSQKKSPALSFSFIRVIRLVRVFRIFKLSRHSRGLKILGKTLSASLNELMLLIMFVMIGMILFSSAMYFAELGSPENRFPSIPDGFWWALITLTTVGFGDVVPVTATGKVVGALCAVAGVLTIALPVPVIVSNFNFFYNQDLREQDLGWLKISHVPACPYRPMSTCQGCDLEPHQQGQQGIDWRKTFKRRKLTRLETVDTSDEEFGELKDRVLRKQGIIPPNRKRKVTLQEPFESPSIAVKAPEKKGEGDGGN